MHLLELCVSLSVCRSLGRSRSAEKILNAFSQENIKTKEWTYLQNGGCRCLFPMWNNSRGKRSEKTVQVPKLHDHWTRNSNLPHLRKETLVLTCKWITPVTQMSFYLASFERASFASRTAGWCNLIERRTRARHNILSCFGLSTFNFLQRQFCSPSWKQTAFYKCQKSGNYIRVLMIQSL